MYIRYYLMVFCIAVWGTAFPQKKSKEKKNDGKANTETSVPSNAGTEPAAPLLTAQELISAQWFHSVEDALAQPENAFKLDLSNQELTSLPSGISGLKNLVFLDISDNRLAEIPSEVFGFTNLVELDAGNNLITAIPQQICSLKKLESLHLNGNQITRVGNEIGCLALLKKLFLHNNEISYLSPDIVAMKDLNYLFLFGNELTAIPDGISDMANLQVLLLHDNHLVKSPAELEKLQKLRYYSEDGKKLDEKVLDDVVRNTPNPSDEQNLRETCVRKAILDSYGRAEKSVATTGINATGAAVSSDAIYQNTGNNNPPGKKQKRFLKFLLLGPVGLFF